MKKYLFAVFIPIIIGVAAFKAAAQEKGGDVKTVPSVDLKRYSGKWYEIARFPNRFQKKCVGNVTADYAINDDGTIQVTNRCLKKDGEYDNAVGKAKIKDNNSNSKLEVRFAPEFLSFIPLVWGDYWIIDLDADYQYSVVGDPSKKYLWILSRTPEMNEAVYQNILRRLETKGYKPNKLLKTPQNLDTVKGNIVPKGGK